MSQRGPWLSRLLPAPLARCALAAAASVALAAGCTEPSSPPPVEGGAARAARVREALTALSADSMRGRMTASPENAAAARFIADRLRRDGIAPAWPGPAGRDSAYFQRVPFQRQEQFGFTRVYAVDSWDAWESLPPAQRLLDANVVGVLPGSDPALRDQAVVVVAHYDHVGVGHPNARGDSIYNGADDNASGVVAVLEIARALAKDPPRRSVVFLFSTGEELGILGTRWYTRNPRVPLAGTTANLSLDMVGRPDPLLGASATAWLTGYGRSSVGAALAGAGLAVVADPRPEQGFFLRSDNAAFACRGVPAHLLSSSGPHADYHKPSDELGGIDFQHLADMIDLATDAVLLLANGPAPAWSPGGRPAGGECSAL